MNLNTISNLFSASFGTSSVSPSTNLIYGSMVASRYLQKLTDSFSSTLSTTLSSLNSSAYELKSASEDLVASNKSSAFQSRVASSDASAAVTATAESGAKTQTYKISISQTAQAQTNKGTALSSDSKTTLEEGTKSIKISSGEKNTTVSFKVEAGQTNKDVLTDMATAINNSSSGVTAKVVNDEKSKTSYLEVTGNDTGAKNTFSISDVSGNAVETTGISKIETESKNAAYKIDGKDYTSSSNNISLDNGKVNITLKDVTKKETTVTVAQDKKAIEDSISSFVKSYNKSLSASSSSDSIISQKLGSQLKSIVSSRQNSLDSIGINVNSDGSLEIDEEKLSKTLESEPDKVKQIMGGSNGVASKTKSLSNRLLVSSSLDTSGNTLYNSDLSSFSYLKNASTNSFVKTQSAGLFVNMLL